MHLDFGHMCPPIPCAKIKDHTTLIKVNPEIHKYLLDNCPRPPLTAKTFFIDTNFYTQKFKSNQMLKESRISTQFQR